MADFRTRAGNIQDVPGVSVVPENKEIPKTSKQEIQAHYTIMELHQKDTVAK